MSFLLGVIASIIASIIISIFSQFYNIYSRKKINFYLTNMEDNLKQLIRAVEYEYYDLCINQADLVIKNLMSIYDEIRILTYFGRKKKLFLTLLFNIENFIDICKNLSVGYSGDSEKRQICNKIKRKYLYDLPYIDKNYLVFTVEILLDLNRSYDIFNTLINNYDIKNLKNDLEKIEIYEKIIAPNSYKTAEFPKYHHINYIFTCNEFSKIIIEFKKKLKNSDNNNKNKSN